MSREYGLEQAINEVLASILPPPAPPVAPPPETEDAQMSTEPAPTVPPFLINNEIRMPVKYKVKRNDETGLIEGIIPEGNE